MGNLFGWKSKKCYKIIMCGLDAAGKTTLLYRLKLGEVVTTIPTVGFNVETIKYKNIEFITWDVGLRDKARPLIRHYLPGIDAVIFVVDSTDNYRIDEAREFLESVITNEVLRNPALLILANKQDKKNVMSIEEIRDKMRLNSYRNIKGKNIIGTVATTGEGIHEGLGWIASVLDTEEHKESLKDEMNDLNRLDSGMKKYYKLMNQKFWSILGYSDK